MAPYCLLGKKSKSPGIVFKDCYRITLISLSARLPPFLILTHSCPSTLHICTHLCTSAPHTCLATSAHIHLPIHTCSHISVQTPLHVSVWNSFITITTWSILTHPCRFNSVIPFTLFLGSKGKAWYFFFCSQCSSLYIFLLKHLPWCILIICFFLTNPQFLNQPEIIHLCIPST